MIHKGFRIAIGREAYPKVYPLGNPLGLLLFLSYLKHAMYSKVDFSLKRDRQLKP